MAPVDRPTRRLTREDVSLTGDVRSLAGLRLLVVDDDPSRALTLAEDLEERVAAVALADGDGEGLETARELDPDAVILDADVFADPGSRVLERLRRDPRLRWAPLLVVPWEELEPFVEPLALLAGALAEISDYDDALRRRGATEDRFEASIERTGPGRLLRLLAESGSPRRVLVEAPSMAVEVDLAEGLAVRAVARIPGEATIEGLPALGRLLELTLGRALVSRLPESPSANVALPLDEALARASGTAPPPRGLPAPTRGPGFDRVPGAAVADPVEPSHSGVVPLGGRALAPPADVDPRAGDPGDEEPTRPGGASSTAPDVAAPSTHPDLTPVASLDLLAMRGQTAPDVPSASRAGPHPAIDAAAPWDDDESAPDVTPHLALAPTPAAEGSPPGDRGAPGVAPEPAAPGPPAGHAEAAGAAFVEPISTVGPPRAGAQADVGGGDGTSLDDDPDFALLAREAIPTPTPGPPDPSIEALGIQTDRRTSTGILVTAVAAVAALGLLLIVPPFIRGLRDEGAEAGPRWPRLPTPSLLATAEAPAPPAAAPVAAPRDPAPRAPSDDTLPAAVAPDSDVPVEAPGARLLQQRGEQALAAGDLAAARQRYEEALDVDPLANRAMAGLARIALAEGDAPAALRWIDQALAERPRRVSYHVLRGDVLRALDRKDDAKRAWRRAILLDPTNRTALGRLRPETLEEDEGSVDDATPAEDAEGGAAVASADAPAASPPAEATRTPADPARAEAAAGELVAAAVAANVAPAGTAPVTTPPGSDAPVAGPDAAAGDAGATAAPAEDPAADEAPAAAAPPADAPAPAPPDGAAASPDPAA